MKRLLEYSLDFKSTFVAEARSLFDKWFSHRVPAHKACCYWTYVGGVLLQRMGIRAVPQGGSAEWQRTPVNGDDGGFDTFEYRFVLEEAIMCVAQGIMPEMHCWLWLPDSEEVLDLSTGYQEEALRTCHKSEDHTLTAEWHPDYRLPDYLWSGRGSQMLQHMKYAADKVATDMTMNYLRNRIPYHRKVGT